MGRKKGGWMVIRTDNFGRSGEAPGFNEAVKDAGPYSLDEATDKALELNRAKPEDSPYCYFPVRVEYKLAKFEI